MTFFEPPPPRPEPTPEPRRPAWMHPEDVLGAVAPVNFVLARTEKVAVAVWGITVFGNGIKFTLAAMARTHMPSRLNVHQFEVLQEVERGGAVPDEFLRFGLSCADGSSATNLRPGFREELDDDGLPASRVLMPEGGGGSDRYWTQSYWTWPLPPPGPITFVCEWPVFEIPLTEHVVDADPILAAAPHSRPVWPDPAS